jgi:hypothetical protein
MSVQPNLLRLRAKVHNQPQERRLIDRPRLVLFDRGGLRFREILGYLIGQEAFYGACLGALVLIFTEGPLLGRGVLAVLGYVTGKWAARTLLRLARRVRESIERRPYVWMLIGAATVWLSLRLG